MGAPPGTSAITSVDHVEPSLTLDEKPPRPLGLLDQVALWGSFGMSLLLPVAAVFVLRPFGVPAMSLAAALTAVVLGSVLGAAALGLAAVPGAVTGAPAMVLLRGLFGRRGSAVPTALNLVQCVGWACLEVLIIGEAATRLTDPSLRPLWTILAGVIATAMAIWPLGLVRQLRRWAVWLVLLASAYLLVALTRQGLPALDDGSWSGFWLAVDVVVALPVSWAPLAADYARHSRSSGAAFGGAFLGYGVACMAYFTLGLLALVTVVTGDTVLTDDVVAGLVAVPLGTLAVLVLLLGETDKAFGNIYSTAMSVQNLAPRVDRRVLAILVGIVAVVVGLLIDVVAYENFLFLLGSVFVPAVRRRDRRVLRRTPPGGMGRLRVGPRLVGLRDSLGCRLRDVPGDQPRHGVLVGVLVGVDKEHSWLRSGDLDERLAAVFRGRCDPHAGRFPAGPPQPLSLRLFP